MSKLSTIEKQRADLNAIVIPSGILNDVGVKTAAVFNGSGILVHVPQDWTQQIIPQLDSECQQINVNGLPLPQVQQLLESHLEAAKYMYKEAVKYQERKNELYGGAAVVAAVAASSAFYSAGQFSTLNNLRSCENVPSESVYAQICDVPIIKAMHKNIQQDALGSAGVAITFALIAIAALTAGRKFSEMASNDFKNAAAAKGNARICLLECDVAKIGYEPQALPAPG